MPAARVERLTDDAPPGLAVDELPVHAVLDRVPALVALVHGPEHRVSYVNDAYTAAFGVRPVGAPAREALPELDELGLLPLLDQVLRSSRPRTVKSRKVSTGRSYTFTCTPVDTSSGSDDRGVLVFATDVTDHAEAAERLRASERRQRETAVTLQRSLLPQELEEPDDLRIAATYLPGGTEAAVGGDWYDVITLGGGRTALVIGDVMGRGVRAAAIMGQVRAAVRAYARLDLRPADMLELLDGVVRDLGEDQIVTCVYAIYDPTDGTLVYANAGHLPPLLSVADALPQRLDGHAPPLGSGPLDVAEHQVRIPDGGLVALYTDGLVERRPGAVDAGTDSLAEALRGASGPIESLPGALVDAVLPEGPDDDVAVLVARVPPAGAGGWSATLAIASQARSIGEARDFVAAALRPRDVDHAAVHRAVLLTSELVTNALLHGRAPIQLRLRLTARDAVIEVYDGTAVLPRKLRPTPDDEHGRGLQLVASLARRWGTRPLPHGKSVWCTVALGRAAGPAAGPAR